MAEDINIEITETAIELNIVAAQAIELEVTGGATWNGVSGKPEDEIEFSLINSYRI
jgi:hypothetical protein